MSVEQRDVTVHIVHARRCDVVYVRHDSLKQRERKDVIAPPTKQEARQKRGRHECVQKTMKFGQPPPSTQQEVWTFQNPEPRTQPHQPVTPRKHMVSNPFSHLLLKQPASKGSKKRPYYHLARIKLHQRLLQLI